jgi:bifunctional non-homologous end joining protein LigD
MAVDKLATYRSMRDFTKTAEPSGARAREPARNSFVVQKHAARRLHYDFRLELDGVLLSWSVPKGPSLSPADKRLAVRTEDHPLDYAGFEGIIPKGQYGGGTVEVWDRGTWQPERDPHEMLNKGRLTFTLCGQKLHGRWHLIRTRGDGKHDNWLLFKSRDDAANDNTDITEQRPESVITGRSIDEIASDADAVWNSNRDNDVAALVARLPLGFALTNLDKVLYPEAGITKAQVIGYLAVVADWALPHIDNRPLTLVRCPEGLGRRGKPCFFQKKILPGAPKSVHTVKIREDSGDVVDYMKVRDMAGLVGLGQLGTLEIHLWGCHADRVERPDFMVFDLDPDEDLPWDQVALAALDVRKWLAELGLESWVKTTGGKGLHVCLPVRRTLDWDEFKAWAKAFADRLAHEHPKRFTSNMAKRARRGKVFLDYLRNGRNATFIAPYSPRARPDATVSTPITWEELAHGVDPKAFTIQTVPARLAKLGPGLKRLNCPWHGIDDVDQAITEACWRAVGGKR